MMNFTRRDWLVATVTGAPVALAAVNPDLVQAQEEAAAAEAAAPGALTNETLGKLLEALGLRPKKTEVRYDFTFAAKVAEEEWNLSMSAVLSTDQKTIWIMAWLDELPRSARDVPRTALLRLLATNDKMGKGKFFSYIPANRRFALQMVVENHSMSTRKFRSILVDLGQTVAMTYPEWSVAGWKEGSGGDSSESEGNIQTTGANAPAASAQATQPAANPSR